MAVIAGIDEAGLGPVLGPLVISVAAFEVPDNALDASLWRRLSGTVTRRSSGKRRTVAIDDSKKIHAGGRGLLHLERSVIACLGSLGLDCSSLHDVLSHIANSTVERAAAYPWYGACGLDLPQFGEAHDTPALIEALKRRMESSGVYLRMIRSEPLLAGQLNELLRNGANKSEAAFSRVALLINAVRELCPGQPMHIHLDRQGGRKYYLEVLRSVFGEAWIWILEESATASRYRIDDNGREIEVHVTVGGDAAQLPTALASMVSKYLRELFMVLLNRYWQERVPGLKATAGYPVDGKRFLADIAAKAGELGADEGLLRRHR